MTDLHATTIPARFRGPDTSGNGGYSAGVLGSLIGDAAQVSLRIPPPLDTPLQVERDGDEWRLLNGDALVAVGFPLRAGDADLGEVPVPPSPDQLQAAEDAFIGHDHHLFPECFVCGPKRADGDGLRLLTGQVQDRELVASHWTPGQDLADAADPSVVDRRIVWAALDCPSYFGGRLAGYPERSVLGTIAVTLHHPVPVGEQCVVTGWPIDQDGRRWHGGSAIHDSRGRLLGAARGTWVDLGDKAF